MVDAHEMQRDVQISEIIRMSFMDELIEDEVRVIWKEVDIESVMEVVIDGMIGIGKKRRWSSTNGHRLCTRPIFMEIKTKIGETEFNM